MITALIIFLIICALGAVGGNCKCKCDEKTSDYDFMFDYDR